MAKTSGRSLGLPGTRRGSFVALPRWPQQRVAAALARQRGTERDDDDNVRERACFALGAL